MPGVARPIRPRGLRCGTGHSAHEERTSNLVKKGTKRPRKLAKSDLFPLIDRGLRKRTKTDLIEMIMAIAKSMLLSPIAAGAR